MTTTATLHEINNENSDIDTSKTLLFLLRESAKVNPNQEYQILARTIADHLEVAIREFFKVPNYDNLIMVNALWSHGHKILKDRPSTAPSDQGGLLKEGARLAA